MTNDFNRKRTVALACGVAVPFVYFGIQLISAAYYPGYSFYSHDASTLGSPGSSFPSLFNVAAMVVGLLMLVASFGFSIGLIRVGVKRRFVWPMFVALVAGGGACINAGVFPLPDERHTSGVLAQAGAAMFILPLVLPFAFRSIPNSGGLRAYLWINLAAFLSLVPIVSGLVQRVSGAYEIELPRYQEFLNNGHGVLQRIAAFVVFVPIAVVCGYILIGKDKKEPDARGA